MRMMAMVSGARAYARLGHNQFPKCLHLGIRSRVHLKLPKPLMIDEITDSD